MTTAGMGNPTPNLGIKRYLSTTPIDAEPEDYLSRTADAVDEALTPTIQALENRPRVGRGLVASTTSAAGDVIVAHGLGVTPTSFIITGRTVGAIPGQRVFAIGSPNATTFTVRVYRADTGAAVATNPVEFYWVAMT